MKRAEAVNLGFWIVVECWRVERGAARGRVGREKGCFLVVLVLEGRTAGEGFGREGWSGKRREEGSTVFRRFDFEAEKAIL